jgi:hypothetical protein
VVPRLVQEFLACLGLFRCFWAVFGPVAGFWGWRLLFLMIFPLSGCRTCPGLYSLDAGIMMRLLVLIKIVQFETRGW